jgi:hypothetical protein
MNPTQEELEAQGQTIEVRSQGPHVIIEFGIQAKWFGLDTKSAREFAAELIATADHIDARTQ